MILHSLEHIIRINRSERPVPHPLYWHPRIAALRCSIGALPIQYEYRNRLRSALYRYADQIVKRPQYKPEEGWDDLEALEQVTLGDWMEESVSE